MYVVYVCVCRDATSIISAEGGADELPNWKQLVAQILA